MKDQIIAILKDHNFTDSEYEDVFSAMAEILHAAADKTQENEPHAHSTIARFRDVANDITDMDYFIERFQ